MVCWVPGWLAQDAPSAQNRNHDKNIGYQIFENGARSRENGALTMTPKHMSATSYSNEHGNLPL